LRKSDYEGWAKGLKKAGYAEDPQYPAKLIGIIEKYGLSRYDSYTRTDIKRAAQKNGINLGYHELQKANGLVYTFAVEGDTFESLSVEFGISKRKIRKYNDLYKEYVIKPGDIIYLEEKNNRARRGNRFHTLQEGESLYSISQKYGVKMKKVYNMNPMYKEYAKPKVGDIIKLR
jgi:LysM repeat protein